MEQEIENPAEHGTHGHDDGHSSGLITTVGVLIALLAVTAAAVDTVKEMESADALGLKNESVLLQTRASDQWAFFQAKSIKKNSYQIAAALATGPVKAEFEAQAEHNGSDEKEIKEAATKLEEQSHEKWDESAHHAHREHQLDIGETLIHVGMAVGSLAIFLRRRLPVIMAGAMAALGIAVSVAAYL